VLDFSLAVIIGLLTGLMSGLFGVGGGIVCTPLLRLLMHVSPHTAVGTTLALIVPTAVSGSINYVKEKLVDWQMVRGLVIPAVVGTLSGAHLTALVHGQVLMLLFSLLIAVSGIDLICGFSQKIKDRAHAQGQPGLGAAGQRHWTNIVGVGLLTGFMAGFFGVGGGFILIPILLAFYKMPVKAAFGTSLVMVASVSIPGTISHFCHDHVRLRLVLNMILGAVPGSLIGSKLALAAKDNNLKRGFGFVMLFMALAMALKEASLLLGWAD
jgi:uncharacterized membrane protein YfcA